MLDALGTLIYEPWIYVLIVTSVLLDVFVPFLPSGYLVITAATAAAGTTAADVATLTSPPPSAAHLPELVFLLLCAATASVLGDVTAFLLARHGGARFSAHIERSRRLRRAHRRLGDVVLKGGGSLLVLARFAPAGRTVMSVASGVTQRPAREFVPWSAVAALVWAGYSVGLGYVGGRLLGVNWGTTALSLVALLAAGSVAAFVLTRHRPSSAAA
ncbi:VTT domain-containing protein [Streptomyces sp. XM4193]|uniref:DedA family protein n=1 Tax=Streptomyces sp. XM4193 TaxID=2929782 RepID=UPI001FF76C2E|nr:VTT domain-containing protein [Streptomyces sp. XM4193]MCK1796111.1 VTT domain-containing protein [Streptomyces sp. XM4193]